MHELTEVLKWYKDLIANAKKELGLLNADLRSLKAFLKDAASNSKKDESFRDMESQIRELVYKVEDTIDTCLTEAVAAKEKNFFSRCLGSNGISLAEQVRSLRQEVIGKLDKVRSMKSDETGTAENTGRNEGEQLPGVTKDQSIRQDKVVDVKDEEDTIINYLTEDKKELDVVSIIGMPGLGKTTLAWKIYQNKKIVDKFPTRIWIHVSQRFKSRDVLLDILRQSIRKDTSSLIGPELSHQELIQIVRMNLEKKEFLLVLDDVWSVDDWEEIKKILPYSNEMGKVLVTSRHEEVGKQVINVHRNPHNLRFLTPDESWKLLQLEVFGDFEDCPPQLEDIGYHIAEQCGGVPLIIVVIGGILKEHFMKSRSNIAREHEWTEVSKNMGQILQRDKKKRISEVVELSYNILPDDLRECFLYMGVFPDNHEIPASTLTRLWIAEGFVQPSEEKTLEETAEEILSELIERNLLIVEKKNLDQVKTCRVHDMIRAFCRSKALQLNLFQVIKKSKEKASEPQNYHRLCLHSELDTFLSAMLNGPQVRSFFCFYKEPVDLHPNYISAIPDAYGLLRVLDSKSIKFCKFPDKVTKLIHLRYITLSIDGLEFIPEQISQMWNLQTLIVETNSPSITMRANMWKMIRLRHFKTNAAILLDDKKWKGEAGDNLQTLGRLSPESCTEAVSRRACDLKTLGIRGKLATLSDTMFLKELQRLEKLKLVNDLLYKLASEDPVQRLPQPNCFPPNLKKLTLSNTSLSWDVHMPTLAKIHTLEVLKLKDKAFTGFSWNAAGDVFKLLQFLLIADTDLVRWEASSTHFPRLRCLVLKNCEGLREIPQGLAKNLEKLEIERLRKLAVESARKIEAKKKQKGSLLKLTVGPGCEQ